MIKGIDMLTSSPAISLLSWVSTANQGGSAYSAATATVSPTLPCCFSKKKSTVTNLSAVLFCSIVVQWVTSHDNSATTNSKELKIAVLTAARESYRDRPLSGGTLQASASGENSSNIDTDSVSRGGGGGIHRSVTTSTKYTPLGEMDVTTYPFRRAENNAAYWSTEILHCDPQQPSDHTLAETTPLQFRGGTTMTTTRPTTATTDPDLVPPGVVVGAGVVETVIVGGKDTAAAEPFGKGSGSNS